MADILKERAWERILVANEWFDGEPEITEGARRAFLREWAENAPSRVTVYRYGARAENTTTHTYFATRHEAEEWADVMDNGRCSVTVIPCSRVMERDRGFVPPQYRPAVWPGNRW